MKKKLYYVVEKETEIYGDVEEYNGNRFITLYEIIDNIPKLIVTIEDDSETISSEIIGDYLYDNDLDKQNFELIQL
jgi:hypothetical protein